MFAFSTNAPPVPDSPEFRRILNLPRRTRPEKCAVPDYRTDAGRAAGVEIRDGQTVGLYELHWNGGLFASLPVGWGKTLFSFLAAHVRKARRPMLFVQASGLEQTRHDFLQLSRHWQEPQPMPLISTYHALTERRNVDMLFQIKPDLLLFDESDQLRLIDKGSAPIRIDRYVDWARKLEIAQGTGFGSVLSVAAFTGTIGRGSLRDFAHVLRWCLGPNCPVPLFEGSLFQWCNAVDDDRAIGMARWQPGVLISLPPYPDWKDAIDTDLDFMSENTNLHLARSGVARRIAETPGVLIYDESSCDQPLVIDFLAPPKDPAIDAAFANFRSTWETPAGEPLTDSLQVYKHMAELGSGFFYRWDPKAPIEWLTARRNWCAFVREQIEDTRASREPLDTEGAVKDAFPTEPSLLAWLAIEPTFKPNPVQQWYSASVVYAAAQWLEDLHAQGRKGLIWTFHKAVAQGLMSVSQTPYYGAKGQRFDVNMRALEETLVTASRNADGTPRTSAILSAKANGRQRNLQHYQDQLFVGWEAATHLVEQRLGRTHRSGQDQPVRATILLTSGETIDAFRKTYAECAVVRSLQSHTQKILTAEINWAKLDQHSRQEGSRWLTRM